MEYGNKKLNKITVNKQTYGNEWKRACKQRKEARLVPNMGEQIEMRETFNINNFRFNKLSQLILQLHCGVFILISDVFIDPHEINIMSGECLLEYEMQVCRKSWVCKLGCTIIVVDKVDAARGCVSDLPAWRQRTKLLTVNVAQVSE